MMRVSVYSSEWSSEVSQVGCCDVSFVVHSGTQTQQLAHRRMKMQIHVTQMTFTTTVYTVQHAVRGILPLLHACTVPYIVQ